MKTIYLKYRILSFSSLIDEKKNDCLGCFKRKDSLFSDLSEKELKILNRNRYSVSYKPNEVICKEGTKPLGLICLFKGKVKMVRRKLNGAEQIVSLKNSGSFVDFRAFLVGSPSLSTSIALEESIACIIKKKDFFKVLKTNNKLAIKIIQFLSLNLIKKDSDIVNIVDKNVRARLSEALILINDIYGVNSRDGFLNLSLKRSELAGLANMTTSNAIKVLSSLKKDKIIEVNKRKIKIHDFDKLKDIAF